MIKNNLSQKIINKIDKKIKERENKIMSNINFNLPLTVSIGNKNSNISKFVAYKDNLLVTLNPGQLYTFNTLTSAEGIYYTKQNNDGVEVGLFNTGSPKATSGVYNSSTGVFTEGSSFNFIQNGNNFFNYRHNTIFRSRSILGGRT